MKKSSHITTSVYQFCRYWFTRLPFIVAPIGDMFQKKIDEILIDLPNVFVSADDILIVGYDTNGRDHDETLK